MILIEIPKSEQNTLQEIILKFQKDIIISEIKQFDGSSEFIHALIPLTTFTIPFIVRIFIERIRQKRYIILKYKGVEISGLSEKNILKVLNVLLEEKYKNRKGEKINFSKQ